MPPEAASCLTPCNQVAKSPPHGAALAAPAKVASHNNKRLDGAPSGLRIMAPRLVAPAGKFNRKPFLRAKHGKVQAQNPPILWPTSNGGQSDGQAQIWWVAERTGRTEGSRTSPKKGVRREITALFCDLRGFTGFSESADPEDVMALLRDYHEAIGQIIFKYGGTLERFAGDGVMVIFNDPVQVENPALQAVLMALDMRAAIGGLIERWRDLGHDLGFGIGIAHGFATLGTIGFEGRFDYAAIGTVSNVASRLCDEAKPGQILISPRVMTKVEKAVTVEPVGEFELKGIRRPLAAYNVVAALS